MFHSTIQQYQKEMNNNQMKVAPTIPSYKGIQHSTYKMLSQLLNHTFQNFSLKDYINTECRTNFTKH
jgi:hypothetical protein